LVLTPVVAAAREVATFRHASFHYAIDLVERRRGPKRRSDGGLPLKLSKLRHLGGICSNIVPAQSANCAHEKVTPRVQK
jgi:hypothetical protein